MAIASVDELVNFVLFAILGVVVVRDTGLIYMGAITGVFAALLDAVVVAAANTMAPPPGPTQPIEEYIVSNLALGTLFAGASGIVYALIQRWSGNRRQK
jgi:membrane associated rhomboid family serine protease